jgi:type I restriction enzyme M protein
VPPSAFAPYTNIATNLLFLTKGEATKEIWYYEHPMPAGFKNYNKTKPISIDEFGPEREWWTNRRETSQAWLVSVDELRERAFDLDVKNPNAPEELNLSPSALLAAYRRKQADVRSVADELKALLVEAMEGK